MRKEEREREERKMRFFSSSPLAFPPFLLTYGNLKHVNIRSGERKSGGMETPFQLSEGRRGGIQDYSSPIQCGSNPSFPPFFSFLISAISKGLENSVGKAAAAKWVKGKGEG